MQNADTSSTLRSMIRHETEQTDRRLSWLGTFQGFLFAALGFSWGKNRWLAMTICILGLTVALLIFISVVATVLAMRRIRAYWIANKPQDYDGPDIFGFFPDRAPWSLFTGPEMLLPLAFATAWVTLIAVQVFNLQ